MGISLSGNENGSMGMSLSVNENLIKSIVNPVGNQFNIVSVKCTCIMYNLFLDHNR